MKRYIAGLLLTALLLGAVPLGASAAGSVQEPVMLMCYSDRVAANYYPFIILDGQLYIRSDTAGAFSGFAWDGACFSRDGVRLEPQGMEYRGGTWFPVESVMREMETAVVEEDGALYFCSASVLRQNFLALYDQMSRFPAPFDDEDLAFQSGLVISAAYDILSNARFSTLWKGYYRPLFDEAIYELAVPQDPDDPIFAWLASAETDLLGPAAQKMDKVDEITKEMGLPKSSIYYADDTLERMLRTTQAYREVTGSLGFSLSDFYQGVARASYAYGLESSYLKGLSMLASMEAEDGKEEAMQAAINHMLEVYQDRQEADGWEQMQNLVDTFATEQLEKKAAAAIFACMPKTLQAITAAIRASDFPKQASAIEKSAAYSVIQNKARQRADQLYEAEETDYVALKYAMLLYYKAAMLGYQQYTFDDVVGPLCAAKAEEARTVLMQLSAVQDRDLENHDYGNPKIDTAALKAYTPTSPVADEDLSDVSETEQPEQSRTGESTLEGFVASELEGIWLDHTQMPDRVPNHSELTPYEKGYIETGDGLIGAWRLDLNEDASDELVVLRQRMDGLPKLQLQVYGFHSGDYSQVYLLYEDEVLQAGANGCYLTIQAGANAHVAYCLYGTMYAIDWKPGAEAVTRIAFPERSGDSIAGEDQSSLAKYRAYYGSEAIAMPAAYVDAANGQLALYLTQASRQLMVGGS